MASAASMKPMTRTTLKADFDHLVSPLGCPEVGF
jgi:hypothetical protein